VQPPDFCRAASEASRYASQGHQGPAECKEKRYSPDQWAVVRIVGVDEWAWRKGTTFGTIIVDLERRQVWGCWRIARPLPRLTGSRGIRKSKLSAVIPRVSVRMPCVRARVRRDRSRIAFIC
jgi:hypothetical protein